MLQLQLWFRATKVASWAIKGSLQWTTSTWRPAWSQTPTIWWTLRKGTTGFTSYLLAVVTRIMAPKIYSSSRTQLSLNWMTKNYALQTQCTSALHLSFKTRIEVMTGATSLLSTGVQLLLCRAYITTQSFSVLQGTPTLNCNEWVPKQFRQCLHTRMRTAMSTWQSNSLRKMIRMQDLLQ